MKPSDLYFDPRQRVRLAQMLSRREMFTQLGMGAGVLALAAMLAEDARADEIANLKTAGFIPRTPHHPARVRRVIYLFQNGGPSQVDLFDPKPELNRQEGKKPSTEFVNDVDAAKTGVWLGSPFSFVRHGRSGLELSELLPELGKHADEIAVIRSMVSEHENHEQACCHMHTGMPVAGRPTIGSWVSYGLGSENKNLPAFVALLDPAGLPVDGARNWSSGWMPPIYQGTPVRATESTPILNLVPRVPSEMATERLHFTQSLNRDHLREHSDNLELEARISNFELAARMQLAATDALDIRLEPASIRTLYGLDRKETATYGLQCLMARRLVEREVRFVQVMVSGQPWDTHANNASTLRSLCLSTDTPVSGLLTDLRQRGLLDDTLVIWTGEFGRTPFAEGKDGRDHHKRGFSLWIAGGGIRGGTACGETDEFGYNAVKDIVSVADFHATVLHLLGLDFRRLTYRHDNRDERLTDVKPARIVDTVLS